MAHHRQQARSGDAVLRRAGAILATMALVMLGLVAVPTTASATKCLEYAEKINEATNVVEIICVRYANDPGTTTPVDDDKNGGKNDGKGEKTECKYNGKVIPCSSDRGTWNASMGCYAQAMSPQPPKDNPWWEGNEDGVIIECYPPGPCSGMAGATDWCMPQIYWAPGPPEAAGPSPRELADRAVASMRLSMGEIGSTPPSTEVKADSMGIIGLPIWLWVADPAPNTTGPITRSAGGGGLTVTATATLDSIEWTLADRSTGAVHRQVLCAGDNAPGTPWSESTGGDGKVPSPTCGITGPMNDQVGYFNLTGTAHWTVEWAGGGQTGTIEVPPQERTVPIEIAELQVQLTE